MATYKVIGKGQAGKYTDDAARQDVIFYCQQSHKTPGTYMGSRAVNLSQAALEMDTLAQIYHNDDRVRLRHSVISFDKSDHISPAQAAQIAEQVIRYFGNAYQILYCVHEDAAHVHIHFVMNQVSYLNGHKYRGTKKEYYDFLQYMKQVLRPYHIRLIPVSGDDL